MRSVVSLDGSVCAFLNYAEQTQQRCSHTRTYPLPDVTHEPLSGVPAVVLPVEINEDDAGEGANGRCHDDRLHQRGLLQGVIISFMSLQDGDLL